MKVAVCVVTYNHEEFIAQCLDSALKQIVAKTIQLDVIVADDMSLDNTVQIIKQYQLKYPARIHLIQQTINKGTVNNTLDAFKFILAHDYKYIAMLDGDDYWCDNNKIQKQVDCCEKNNLVMVHSNYCVLTNKLTDQVRKSEDVPQGDVLAEAVRKPLFINCTIMFRTDCLYKMDFETIGSMHQLVAVDHLTNVIVASQGNVGFIEDVTAVWRRHNAAQTSLKTVKKSLQWIEHECVQGRYLNKMFPTLVHFTTTEENVYRLTMLFRTYVTLRCYQEAKSLWLSNTFLHEEPISPFMSNVLTFKLYFVCKKMNAFVRLCKAKI